MLRSQETYGYPGTVGLGELYGSVALEKYVHIRNHPRVMYMATYIREVYGLSVYFCSRDRKNPCMYLTDHRREPYGHVRIPYGSVMMLCGFGNNRKQTDRRQSWLPQRISNVSTICLQVACGPWWPVRARTGSIDVRSRMGPIKLG